MDDARFLRELRRFWDEIAAGGPATPGELDPELAAIIRRVHTRRDVPAPDPAYAKQLRESLMHATTAAVPFPIGVPLDGRAAPPVRRPFLPAVPRLDPRRTWPLAQVALALLLVAAVVIGYLFYLRPYEQRMAAPATPAAEGTPAAEWPMYKGDPGRTSAMPGAGPDGEPVEIWRFGAKGPASRSPAVAGGVAYLQAGDGNIYALDALTGAERWRAELGDTGESTPTVAGGLVYVSTLSRELIALDAASGEERWRFAAPVGADSTPLVVDGVLYVGSDEGIAYAIDPATGAERWQSPLSGPVGRSLAYAAGLVYAATGTGHLHAFDAATGEERWQFTGIENEGIGTPSVAEGLIYLNQRGTMYALDAATGEERWQKSFEGARPVAVADGRVFSGGLDGVVYAVDAATGDDLWTFTTGDSITPAPTVVGDTVYVASADRTLYALDVATGEERWGFGIDGISDYGPSVAYGMIYVSTDAGTLYALGGSGMEQVSAPIVAADDATPIAAPDAGTPASAAIAAEFLWEIVAPPGEDLSLSPSIAIDLAGNLWVVDGIANQYRIYSPEGELIEQWGEAGDGDGQFNFHRDQFNGVSHVAFRPDGGFYVADSQNFRIQQFDAERNFVRAWGGFGQDDGQFEDPLGIVIGANGDVFVIDDKRLDVQKFTADGEFLLKFGGPGSAPGEMNPAWGDIDADGNLWLGDWENNRVQQFAPDGTYLRMIGDSGSGEGQLSTTQGVAIDAEGRIFVADSGNNRIAVYAADGTFLQSINGADAGGSAFAWPTSIALDGQGNLYVHEYDTFKTPIRIQKFRLTPIETTAQTTAPAAPTVPAAEFLWRTTGGPQSPESITAVAVDPQGLLWLADGGSGQFQIFAPNGTYLESWGEAGDGEGQFDFKRPSGLGGDAVGGIAFAPDGGFYVADSQNKRIQHFDRARTFVRAWGEFGTGDGQFLEPFAVHLAPDGSVYVIDDERDDVQVFTPDGQFLRKFGGHGTDDGELNFTGFGAFDGEGNFWIADAGNHRLQQFAPDGTWLRTIDSSGEPLRNPQAVAIDDEGRLFVTDTENNRIVVLDVTGQPLAAWTGDDVGGTKFVVTVGVVLDGLDNLYVHDIADGHGALQKFRLFPQPATVSDAAAPAGTPSAVPVTPAP